MDDPDFPLDAEALAQAIDIPVSDWPGRCHTIADAVLRRVPVRGLRLARGHWHGNVSRKSVYHRAPCQHSWLVAADGRILDPTRWAMERPDRPAIYLGDNDVYDEGGLQIRAMIPPSLHALGQDPLRDALLRLPADRVDNLAAAVGLPAPIASGDAGAASQISWKLQEFLGTDPDDLVTVQRVFTAMRDAGLKAFIQIDLWQRVMEPDLLSNDRSNHFHVLPPVTRTSELGLFARLLMHFVSLEDRDCGLEAELQELGCSLDELHSGLNRLERLLKSTPEPDLYEVPACWLDSLCVIAGDLLGKGFGTALRVERFAASRGYGRRELDSALRRIGGRVGYDLTWSGS